MQTANAAAVNLGKCIFIRVYDRWAAGLFDRILQIQSYRLTSAASSASDLIRRKK